MTNIMTVTIDSYRTIVMVTIAIVLKVTYEEQTSLLGTSY